MYSVGFVGAGAASAAAAYSVSMTRSDVEVTVLEKSGGVCGRAATRRRGDFTFDYGANYLKDDDPRVNELVTRVLDTDGLETIEEPVWVFDESDEVRPGREIDEVKRVYRDGLTQIAKRLFSGSEAEVHCDTEVESLEREEAGWLLHDDGGRSWSGFDAVVLNPPAPQTSELLRRSGEEEDAVRRLAKAAGDVPFRTVYTAVLGYGFSLDRPYYALVDEDKRHDVGWIAREGCKPGRVPDGSSVLVVQANHDWSVDRFDESGDENAKELAEATAEIVGDARLSRPDWSYAHGWRYALTEGQLSPEVRETGEEIGLYCTGDWVAGEARLHAALRQGLETGDRLAEEL